MNLIKSISILLLMAASSAAFADWTKVTTGYQSTSYADLSSLQKTGDVVSMNVLVDYVKVPFDGNNLPYLSLTMQGEYNCATQQFRTTHITSHSDHMGAGDRPYTSSEADAWQPVLPKHNQEALLKAACGKSLTPLSKAPSTKIPVTKAPAGTSTPSLKK
jgi:hypothetical protein